MSSTLTPKKRITLKIESLAFGNGAGVGRYDGLVIFVADTAPGDVVEAEVTKLKKSFAEARLIKVQSPSPQRTSPPCPVSGVCGGCFWQHVEYQEQLQQKESIIRNTFSRLAPETAKNFKIVPCSQPFHYRNRIQVHKAGNSWGFLKRKSNSLVPIDSCLIADHDLNKLLQQLMSKNKLPENCRVELLKKPDGELAFEVTGTERDEIGFSQVNQEINERLISYIIEIVKKDSALKIHDLYAGNGNFSFPLASNLEDRIIYSVELNSRAHTDAIGKQALNPLANLTLIKGSSETHLKSELVCGNDLVIVDPPRAGMQPEALKSLFHARPKTLIYISCDPMTLKRDLTTLIEHQGYSLSSLQPFDMFPQTPHMETVAVLNHQ